jgi:hypothetical protein
MKNYSIEKVGTDYVVKVDDQSVMKMGSRRRAAQLVVEAQELLEEAPLVPTEEISRDDDGVDATHHMQGNAVVGSSEGAV